MKFGHNLSRNQVPEWASSYINYKGLKKLIKTAAEAAKRGLEPDLAQITYTLDRNVEDVDGFYNKKYAESARRIKLLQERYGRAAQIPEGMDKDEAQDLMGALLELRGQLRKLQWYGEVNRKGFVKITKKLDKKVPSASTQQRYLASMVDPKAFAHNFRLVQDMRAINEWLSALGEAKTFDDTGSTHSASSLGRGPARTLNLPSTTLDALDQAIRADDPAALSKLLGETASNNDLSSAPFQQLLLHWLQRSISCKSKACIDRLLPDIVSLEEEYDINKRNCIHRMVINIGRSKSDETSGSDAPAVQVLSVSDSVSLPAGVPHNSLPSVATTEDEPKALLSKNDESVQLLAYLLDHILPRQRESLNSRDSYGRLPLHYAAQYGVVVICEEITKHMQDWGQFNITESIDSPYWQDDEGNAPLHLSVTRGHARTTETLLKSERRLGESDEKRSFRKNVSKSGAVLALAVKSNFVLIVNLLVEAGVDVNYQDDDGETALHVAARYGHEECAQALIRGSAMNKTDVDVPEKIFGWTPLFIACVDGHLGVAKLLVTAGANMESCDLSGWTPKEHAALRGHVDITEELIKLTPVVKESKAAKGDDLTVQSPSPTQPSSVDERKSKNSARDNPNSQRMPDPIKSFGHRYLTKETMVLVSLGSMDIRKNTPAVQLDDIPLADAHATQLDTALSVVVSASGATGDPTVIDLPVQENISTEPITFMTMDATKVKLLFDIVPTYAGSNERIVGRGVALLSSIKPSIGSKRITLQGDVRIPIIAATNLNVIGLVNFNFLIITPFSHPNMSITEQHTYWRKMTAPMVIGHRGLGKNVAGRNSLQLGENTIQSFIAAANLGASYVEFDVQLTKDHVPVIYHDFLVSETGIDAPVHTLTLEQFMHVSQGQTPRESRPQSPVEQRTINETNNSQSSQRRQRSYSVDVQKQKVVHDKHNQELLDRMKHTWDYKKKGFKGNSRGNFIQAPFTTLEEMFKKLPETTGFNIEMKYPMLHESEEHDMDQYAVELNEFVDTVLRKVYDLAGKRNIIFSSFNPDICLMLSFKQPSIPIMFLTDAGTSEVGDVRAASLQEAIRFASRWNLLGIVSAADPLVMCPRLVRVVKESGLVCVSYGSLNNEEDNVKLQVQEGIDAVIVDSVLKIRKGLTGSSQTNSNNTTNGTSTLITASNTNGGAGDRTAPADFEPTNGVPGDAGGP
ncbi:GDPD-domain-containing protein [Polyplosphaeria fusca]|uniref:GDPD-domain-containing protein n=1 Tax=Polyplosphaeria fusca TaxID=682080 RepID=A0A9P4V7T4_9PLEO|nr:GDPD-domain-containing protein [Polyplosphaeria fusca]